MYRAKDQGKHCYRYYTSSMQHQVEKRIRLEHSVRDAILKEDFWLAYQPQVRCRDGVPEAVEALMRWPSHNHLNLSPADFIPVIEDIGMITRASRNVMKMSADAVHRISYAADYPVRVAINISMRHLFNNCLHDDIEKLITSSNLTPWRMEIELTESTLMGDPVRARQSLEAIRELGVSIAIDDFGTGYSSLSYLRRLPADVLKIDRSFITEIGRKAEAEAILLSLIDLAHALGMRVVAEGVENAEQQAFLEDANCDLLQGYHICRPCTEPDLIEWLRGTLPLQQ
jgi:EAL domain-containing protein (putative c-di-GMP-specific phosphodiesterase class I)